MGSPHQSSRSSFSAKAATGIISVKYQNIFCDTQKKKKKKMHQR